MNKADLLKLAIDLTRALKSALGLDPESPDFEDEFNRLYNFHEKTAELLGISG